MENNIQRLTVKLSPPELLMGAILGSFRNVQSYKHAKPAYGFNSEKDGWQMNIIGCLGEMAFAKAQNSYFNAAIGDYHAADVDNFYQIRSSPLAYENNAHLRLHPTDNPEQPYILALVGMGLVKFAGWLYGHEGMLDHYYCDLWNTGREAFFIGQADLHAMETLPRLLPGFAGGGVS